MAQTIYVVQPGDTVYNIAQKFDVPVEGIVILNDLENPSQIQVGQQLRIPAYLQATVLYEEVPIYQQPVQESEEWGRVRAGTHLQVLGVVEEFYQVTYLNHIGWLLRDDAQLEAYDGTQPIASILGFYTLEESRELPSSYASYTENIDALSEAGLFFYRLNPESPLEFSPELGLRDQDVVLLTEIGHQNNVRVMPVIHNLLYGDVTISYEVVNTMLSSEENRQSFITQIINLVDRFNFDGVNMDLEDVYESDEELLSVFYQELGEALRENGKFLSVSVPSRIRDEDYNPFSDPFNYSAIGVAVDEFVVMLYNEHGWPGSGPGPVVSAGWMRQVLTYAVERVDPAKIMAAVSVFGFDFNLVTDRPRYVSYEQAMALAQEYGATIRFDEESQTPTFRYTASNGQEHEVWFENAESLLAKIRIADEFGIKGVGIWRLGLEDPAVWDELRSQVIVRK